MKLPRTFQTDILSRFMSEKELGDLYQEYKDNRKITFRTREVTKKDLNILTDYKAGMLPNELMRKHHVTRSGINTSLRIAALSKIK